MKVKVLESGPLQVVPPLTLEVTYHTEAEMRAYIALVGPIPDKLNVLYSQYKEINSHLDKYSPEGA